MVLGIDEKIWLDSTKINVISGMAGSAKSGFTRKFFDDNNMSITWCTSTHQLRRAAEERFDTKCFTIAGGAFLTTNGKFYNEFKEPETDAVVMDEVLQSNLKRIIDFCNEFVGKTKIVLLTDVHQMLAPDAEATNVDLFKKFIKQDNVVFSELTYTKRADNDETRAAYNYYYNLDGDTPITVSYLKKTYPTIEYSQMPYNYTDTYITHTNDIEDYMYLEKSLSTLAMDPQAPLIPKGGIASAKNPGRTTHPILSQNGVDKNKSYEKRGYWQVGNIATPTRFQGSEVEAGTKLYYIISDYSKISAREFYTVVTRLHRVDDLVIVICNEVPENGSNCEIHTFYGLPIKKEITLRIDHEGDTEFVSRKQMNEFLEKNYPDTDTVYYNKDIIYSNEKGDKTRLVAMKVKGATDYYDAGKARHGVTAGSLARREGAFQYSYIPAIYKIVEREGLTHVRAPRMAHTRQNHKDCYYDVDLSGSYSLFLKYCDMPIEGYIQFKYDKDLMNFYLYKGTEFSDGSFMTDILADYVKANDLGEVKYLFSVPKQKGSLVGDYIYKMHHTSKESKEAAKDIHFGYYEKPFLEKAPTNDCYLIRDNHKYEIIMAAIMSCQSYFIHNLKRAIDGDHTTVDAVYIKYQPDQKLYDMINDTFNKLNGDFIEYKVEDIRFDKEDDKRYLYRKGDKPKSRAELHKEYLKQRRANETPEQREERLRKDRERKRLAKLNKQ